MRLQKDMENRKEWKTGWMSIGQKGMMYAAECMAAGAYRLVKEPEILERAWKEM